MTRGAYVEGRGRSGRSVMALAGYAMNHGNPDLEGGKSEMYELYYNHSEGNVTDNQGNVFTIPEAKLRLLRLLEHGTKYDCNIAFQQLVRLNWDRDKYQEHIDSL